jgi:sulfide:quinone oxidoreductase
MSTDAEPAHSGHFKVVIVGGGVAGAEALLALHHLLPGRSRLELISASRELIYRPLAVAQPFGLGEGQAVSLDAMAEEHEADFRQDVLTAVDPEQRTVAIRSGLELDYDALLLTLGAHGIEQLPGALTYDGGPLASAAYRTLLDELEAGKLRRIAFAAPTGLRWVLPLYELALLTAHHARQRCLGVELLLVSEEVRPLAMFGRRASDALANLLKAAAVEFCGSQAAAAVEAGGLVLASGELLDADRVVALPRLEVPPMPGVPQGPSGFIGTDLHMQVEGLGRVYAAGDATWFPIKQGGLAAQQADVAAQSIASCADPAIAKGLFRPVLRGALLTGAAPLYLRSGVAGSDTASAAGAAPLWWPPAKIAARYTAPYLSGGGEEQQVLEDVPALHGEDVAESAADHQEAVELALASADADARWKDYDGALRWLSLAEQLNFTLPPAYTEKRRRWSTAAGTIT